MLQGNKPRISALPPQSPQLVVNGVARARTRARTVQTNHCGDCGGNQDSCGFPADSGVAGSVRAPVVGHRAGAAARPAVEGRDNADSYPQPEPGRAAALSLLEAGRTPAIDPLRLQQHAILALDLGQKTGWAVRNADGAIASGTVAAPEGPASSPAAMQWRIIPGWPDYEVSEWGDVRRRTPARNARPGMVLAPFYRKNGYAQLQLNANRRRRRFFVHRLVAVAFIGPQPTPAHEIAHLSGNRAHNHHSNLRWVLHRENEDHKHQHGTRQRGSRIGTARLNEEQVRLIKSELRAGNTQTELAARFNVHPSTVSLIARGQFWRHVL